MKRKPVTRRSATPASADAAPDSPSVLAPVFRGRRVLVGVTGGIAAYKACHIVSRLAQAGAGVTVAMTEAATRFVTPLTFQALSGRPVYTSAWEHVESHDPQHVSLAREAAVAIVAPATMDCLAKLATGRTEDVVTLILSAIDRSKTPVFLAPSMNDAMWNQPSTQRNVRQLVDDGFHLIGPGEGWQACRTVGAGRMTEPAQILEILTETLRLRRNTRSSRQNRPGTQIRT
jgi:phosphopantothenoylcysteine decarboxylase/phosphopantothenate--cysteine ligase